MKENMIVGVLGWMGSGKGTIGDHLVANHGFRSISFASSLKDAVAVIFRWPRHMLEGDTEESRAWREQPDEYWSRKMDQRVTPRWVLQNIGTDVLRHHFYDGIWIASLEKAMMDMDGNFVITDVRFPNEIRMLKTMGGHLWWVRRGPLPQWYQCAARCPDMMPVSWPGVHSSEYEWVAHGPFTVIDNDGGLDDLRSKVDGLLG